ncbi:Uncharacterised protein [Bordetella pertussis]|nr:Uncharacterised protein [Bordetella pertussis]CFW48525.1 Uncharacterised protein [Bordetella pertussis]
MACVNSGTARRSALSSDRPITQLADDADGTGRSRSRQAPCMAATML